MNIYERAVSVFGAENQKKKAIEELSELIRAIARDDRANILEEITDVMIMIEQLRYIYEEPFEIEEIRTLKIQRLRKLIEAKENEGKDINVPSKKEDEKDA